MATDRQAEMVYMSVSEPTGGHVVCSGVLVPGMQKKSLSLLRLLVTLLVRELSLNCKVRLKVVR